MATPSAPEESFTQSQARIQAALLSTTRTMNAIVAQDLPFLRSLDSSAASALDAQHARLLSLAERLLANAAAGTDMVNPKLPDADAVETGWPGVVDVLDGLLERADTCLDTWQATGGREPEKEAPEAQAMEGVEATGSSIVPATATPKKTGEKVPRNLDIPKPQQFFETATNNQPTDAFVPILTSKPWATVSLKDSLAERSPYNDITGSAQWAHPYQTEIEQYQFPASVYTKAAPIPYSDFETTSATLVDTPEAMYEMLEELKQASEIAVDLEHHDYRSYIGLVSLMQISTRNKDWIVDTLKPWRRRLECLNEVFANPNILKVFQGAHSDIIWLQRDLGLYIVGLFDTHHAARAMRYPGASLAFLLSKFCNFDAQKQYQTADWRMRPLPQAMLDYARSDTHFLLYIYDNMRNELIEKSNTNTVDGDLIQTTLNHSKEECLQRYEYPFYDHEHGLNPGGWYRQLSRAPALFSKEQFAVFRAAHAWRDLVARQEDESVPYIMSNHALLNVAREMPSDRVKLFTVATPISQPVRLRADELVGRIKQASEGAAVGPEMREIMESIDRIDMERRKERWSAQNTANEVPTTKQAEAVQASEATSKPIVNRVAEKLAKSHLWGTVSSAFQRSKSNSQVELALPLPDLTAEIFEPVSKAKPVPEPEQHTYVQKNDRDVKDGQDDIFIVKQLGGRQKRKRGIEEADITGLEVPDSIGHVTADSVDEMSIDDQVDDAGSMLSKSDRKKARKAAKSAAGEGSKETKEEKRARKAAKKAAAAAAQNQQVALQSQEPFDYAAQPSLLQGARIEKSGKYKRPKKGKGPFDTYSRAADAPTGLGRTQKERGGKQQTFGH